MNANHPVAVTSFLKRFDCGEMEGRLNLELSKLSDDQLLTVGKILAERDKPVKRIEIPKILGIDRCTSYEKISKYKILR